MESLKGRTYGSTGRLQSQNSDSLPKPATSAVAVTSGRSWTSTAITAGLIILWWVTCAEYNVDNKMACKYVPAPFTIAAIQLSFGFLWFVPLWIFGFRSVPRFHSTKLFFTKMVPQGACHCFVHVGAVFSMHAGAVSFCHIVKAFEPVTTSILSIFVLKHFFSLPTYLTLLPIVGGVGFASASSGAFNWFAFWMAMLSNIGGSLRGVFAKRTMSDPKAVGVNLTPPNVYAVITIVGTIICWPCALALEGFNIYYRWGEGAADLPPEERPSNFTMARYIITSSFFYYFFNEVAFHVLGRVDQLTHAVCNTMKRVYIIVRSVMTHEKSLGLNAWIGSGVAILGTFMFSVSKEKFG